jgi:thioredoxin 2
MAEKILVVCPYCNTTNRLPKERLRDGGKCGHCHRILFDGTPVTVDDPVRFAKQIEVNDVPVLVDFSAEWCQPCHALAPIYQEAAAALEPDVRLLKVDIDKVPDLAARYVIRGVPTLALFLHGKELARFSGLMPLHQLLSWTRQHLKHEPAETGAPQS